MSENLYGRVAIITGASRGIGRAIALKLAAEGVRVTVAAKSLEATERLPGSIFTVAAEIEALGSEALPYQCDVREDEQIEACVAATAEKWGRVDILINNAGALWWRDMLDTPMKRFDLMMDINARAPFCASRAVLPHMIRGGWGHIINMSPPLDFTRLPGHVGYLMSKYGMTMIAMGLSQEMADHNIACNALWPATLIESQATINWGLAGPEGWRKADVLVDATLAIVKREPRSYRGHAAIDEEVLMQEGVTDFSIYNCVEGGDPIRMEWARESTYLHLLKG